MVLQSQLNSADAQALDELHQGIVVELGRWNKCDAPTTSVPDATLQAGIERSINAIEAAGTAIDLLTNKCRRYEEGLRSSSKTIGELKSSLEGAHQKLARAEIDAQSASGKAARMEAQTKELRDQIKKMEAREADLTANLDRMVKAVKENFTCSNHLADHPFRKAVGE